MFRHHEALQPLVIKPSRYRSLVPDSLQELPVGILQIVDFVVTAYVLLEGRTVKDVDELNPGDRNFSGFVSSKLFSHYWVAIDS